MISRVRERAGSLSPARLPALLLVIVLVAAGFWLGRQTAPSEIHEVSGVVTAISDSGRSLCIGATADSAEAQCQAPLTIEGESLPEVGTAVVAGKMYRPATGDEPSVGVWLYVIPAGDN
jgi:hypothetical protein